MDPSVKKALEAAGWAFGDAADFLGMTPEERVLLDTRAALAAFVRRRRAALDLTQKQLATRLKTSQPRVVKIEQGAETVTLDQMFRAFIALGGRVEFRSPAVEPTGKKTRRGGKRAGRATAHPGVIELGEPAAVRA